MPHGLENYPPFPERISKFYLSAKGRKTKKPNLKLRVICPRSFSKLLECKMLSFLYLESSIPCVQWSRMPNFSWRQHCSAKVFWKASSEAFSRALEYNPNWFLETCIQYPCQMGGFRLENKPDSWWILKTRKLSSQLGPFLQKQVQQPRSAFPSNVLFRYEGRVIRFWSSILRQLWSIKMVSKTNSQTIYLCQVSVENMSNAQSSRAPTLSWVWLGTCWPNWPKC